MRYRQVELWDKETETRMVCWVDDRPDLRAGKFVTLKETPDITWYVVWVSTMVQAENQRRTWRVGGIQDAR